MSSPAILLVDFGASRVKGALAEEGHILARHEEPAPQARYGVAGEVEIDPRGYGTLLKTIIGRLSSPSLPRPKALWLCTEMHGFMLEDGKGTALTPYISWRDMRATYPLSSGDEPTLSACERQSGEQFSRITGMRLKSGLPFLGLAHLARQKNLPRGARFLTLPEWIAVSVGSYAGRVHVSSAAGTGLYDLDAAKWSETLLAACGASSAELRFADPTSADDMELGCCDVGQRAAVSLCGGFGDLQAAVYGAGVPSRARAAFNIGTGSQVVRAVRDLSGKAERRPYFANRELAAITHIPSGRALNLFAGLFDGIAHGSGGAPGLFWRLLGSLTFDQILNAPLTVNMNAFPGAWRFSGGASIGALLERCASAETVVASIALAWLRQYAEALGIIDADREEREVVVAGGLPRRCPAALKSLEVLTGRRMLPSGVEEDETLAGLLRLAAGT
ncbi:MAG: hypothetical protein EPO20_00455 [Betaproteobacteria bacterium]|nr:MAG: hypothetical protein EPO20_00455 [Betaproteobacteria bacterium]